METPVSRNPFSILKQTRFLPSLLRLAVTALVLIVMATPASARLAAWYQLDEAHATPANALEIVGGGSASLVGYDADVALTRVLRGEPSTRPAFGTAYRFIRPNTTSGGALNLGNAAAVQPTDKFTISFWFRLNTANTFARFLESQSGNANTQHGIRIDTGGTGNRVRAMVRSGAAANSQLTHSTVLQTDGKWYFAAFRYDSTSATDKFALTVIDGTPATVTDVQIAAATEKLTTLATGAMLTPHAIATLIGAEVPAANSINNLNGYVDNLAFFDNADSNGVLSNVQLAAVYNLGPQLEELIPTFTASASPIVSGSPVTLNWTVAAGLSALTLSDGINAPVNVLPLTTGGAGSTVVNPTATTTFTLSATKNGAVRNKQITVAIGTAPVIQSFNASSPLVVPGGAVTLNWTTTGATTLTLNPGALNVTAQTSSVQNPASNTTYQLVATNSFGTSSATALVNVTTSGPPRITEIVAANSSGLTDGLGRASDWIEIFNPDTTPRDIAGYTLTDNPALPTLWAFPAGTTIPAGGYLVVFASSSAPGFVDTLGNLHTTFSLNNNGEYLAFRNAQGALLQEFAPALAASRTDASYGEVMTGPQVAPPVFAWFTQPTPRAANGTPSVAGLVADTQFSVKRGWKTAPFAVAITTLTPGASIRYTLDGTPPTETSGTIYTAPLNITATTILRAIAYKAEFQATNVDSQSYFFLGNVLTQPAAPAGYPATWGGRTADYAMDPEVVGNPAYADQFDEAFGALATLSLTFTPGAFFDPATGIYQQPLEDGPEWERPVSIELLPETAGEAGFQINGGVRIQGSSSRSVDTPKHSLSLRFRGEYGDAKLQYPLYTNTPHGAGAATEFDYLQLRPEYNFGWMHRHYYQCAYAQYGRDQWASDLFLAMGGNGMRGRWVHLFLNGIYWGLYDLHERPDADHMANYFGGLSTDYDTVNSAVATDGDLVAFNAMMDLAYGTITAPATYAAIQQYLDVDAFIDYMMLNAYIGNRDWDSHNWRAARKRVAGATYLFFPWDAEFAISHVAGGAFNPPPVFESTTLSTDVTTKNLNRNPTGLQMQLATNAEYRLRYADRVRRHFFNGGALTAAQSAATWMARAPAITQAVVAESARWGDFRRDVDPGVWPSAQFALFTRDTHFLPVQQWLLGTYFPQRSGIVLAQLRTAGLYPATSAPDFSSYGGRVPRGFQLTLTAAATIYFTIDGSDPRLAGGAINPAAQTATTTTLNQSTTVKARARSGGGEWSALTEAFFTVGASDLVLSELMYNPPTNPLAEFIELVNRGAFTVSLAGLHFTNGVNFNFDANSSLTTLAAGERLLIVRDLAAFQSIYGTAHNARIAGIFQNATSLDNGGETLTLTDGSGFVVFSVQYDDTAQWPAEADGAGRSLVYRGGDTANPVNWRASIAPGGNPATSDTSAPGNGDLITEAGATLSVQSVTPLVIRLSQSRPLGADHIADQLHTSLNLTTWQPPSPAASLVSRGTEGANEVLVWEVRTNTVRQFFRIYLTSE